MFGLFKRKNQLLNPGEPIELKTSIEIARPASEIYALLDFDDTRNQLRVRGHEVRRVADDPTEFRLWYNRLPDHTFLFEVTDAIPDRLYAFSGKIVPPIGCRVEAHEAYFIDTLTDVSCRVNLINTILHLPDLTEAELAEELGRSSLAAANSLTKLKLQAEQGIEAVEQFEREHE